MLLGSWGCLIDAIAVILRFFLTNSERLWPLYTLFIIAGWTIYAPAQLLVLYSRLHLVNQGRRLQRWVLTMIVIVSSLMIIPTWVLDWQAYNPYNKHLSALYSPREAIVDRCTQLGYTFAESILSGVYIWSLAKLLNLKSNVRQRRVMIDLIYVNVVAICLDILTVVLVFLNLTGISHPIQTFSYILKLKLEFLVLNQLMAVAARGMQKESFAERRYHHPSISNANDSSAANSNASKQGPKSLQDSPNAASVKELVIPQPTMSKAQAPPKRSGSHEDNQSKTWPAKMKFNKRASKGNHDDPEQSDDEEVGIHMWENKGHLVMDIPWFRKDGQV